jgi:hypothetical protein
VICFDLENLAIWVRQKTNRLPAKKTAGRQITTKLQISSTKLQAPHQKAGRQANSKQGLKLFFNLLFVICFFGHLSRASRSNDWNLPALLNKS